MPFYEKGAVRIHYEEVGSGFPLLVIPGGGLNSTVAGLANHPFNPTGRVQKRIPRHRGRFAQRQWRPVLRSS